MLQNLFFDFFTVYLRKKMYIEENERLNVLIYDYNTNISVDLPRCKMLFYLNETIVCVYMMLRDEYLSSILSIKINSYRCNC